MMPSPLPNGARNNINNNRNFFFRPTVSEHKLRRLTYLLLLFRLTSFSFSLASAVFTLSNSSHSSNSNSNSNSSLDFFSFRFLFAANAIVAIYSLFQTAAATWEILKGPALLPLSAQLWFDFSHDQVFAYMVLAAAVAGAAQTATIGQGPTCQGNSQFCIQADISVALCFAGFLFLALATLTSGFRLVSFLATGSPFPM